MQIASNAASDHGQVPQALAQEGARLALEIGRRDVEATAEEHERESTGSARGIQDARAGSQVETVDASQDGALDGRWKRFGDGDFRHRAVGL